MATTGNTLGGTQRQSFVYRQKALAKYHVRRTLARLDNREVRIARNLVRRARTAPPLRLLIFADSVMSFISPKDTDRRPLWQMVADEAGTAESTLAICGPGYNTRLFSEYARLLTATDARPIVVLPLSIRLAKVQCIHHPAYGHQRAGDFLRALPDNPPLRSIRASFPLPTDADFEEFDRLPFPTGAGNLTVGDYTSRLRTPQLFGLDSEAEMLLRMQYYHEGELDPDGLYRSRYTDLGRHLHRLGVPVIVYASPLPIDSIRRYLGEQLLATAETEYARLEEALRAGLPDNLEVVRPAHTPEGELMDPLDASEHLNEIGRIRVARDIAAAVRRATTGD